MGDERQQWELSEEILGVVRTYAAEARRTAGEMAADAHAARLDAIEMREAARQRQAEAERVHREVNARRRQRGQL